MVSLLTKTEHLSKQPIQHDLSLNVLEIDVKGISAISAKFETRTLFVIPTEYGASAEVPLIDSVFAGRLVSIVTCHQCHQVSYQAFSVKDCVRLAPLPRNY